MRRLAALLLCSSLSASARVDAAPKPRPTVEKARDVRRPPKAMPTIARREISDGPVVTTLARPGSAEVVVAFSVPVGDLDPRDAHLAAHAVFPLSDEARSRGVSRDVRVDGGAVVVIDTAPSAELPFVVFALGGAVGVTPTPAAIKAARSASLADAERAPSRSSRRLLTLLEGQPPAAPTADVTVVETAAALGASRPLVAIVGDVDTARAVALVEQHFPARGPFKPARGGATDRRARVDAGASTPRRATLDANERGLVWAVATDPRPVDAGGDLALFALGHRLGAKLSSFSDHVASARGFVLVGDDARRLEGQVSRLIDELAAHGVTADELAAFRAAREAEVLSRGLFEWALRLSSTEHAHGDARLAARELAWAWEVDDARLKRALSPSGPVGAGLRLLVAMGPGS